MEPNQLLLRYFSNKEKDKIRKRIWRQSNREIYRLRNRESYQRCILKRRAEAKQKYQKNPEAFKKRALKWIKENPKKRSKIMVFQNYKRRYRLKTNGGNGISINIWRKLKDIAGYRCLYCEQPIFEMSIDHFMPISLGGKDELSNIVPCCKLCNSRKNNQNPNVWILKWFGIERLNKIKGFLRFTPQQFNNGEAYDFLIDAFGIKPKVSRIERDGLT